MSDEIATSITPARITLAWDPTGAFRGGELVSTVSVYRGELLISRSETGLVPIRGTVQDGIDLSPLLGEKLASAVAQVGVLTADRDALIVENAALKSRLVALVRDNSDKALEDPAVLTSLLPKTE